MSQIRYSLFWKPQELRNKSLLTCPSHKTAVLDRSFKSNSYNLYNAIPFRLSLYNIYKSKKEIKRYLLNNHDFCIKN